MYIPSYDDLTPSIPDISMREAFDGVARLLPEAAAGAEATAEARVAADGSSAALFACLRSARGAEEILRIARDFSPRIERHGAGCVVLDVSGLGRLLGDAQAIGAELHREAAACGRGMRVAVAPTQTAAQLLSAACPGLTVAATGVAGAMADLPLATLQVLSEEHAGRIETFRRWGLRTLGDLAALPAAELSQRLGQPGVALQRLACGIDPAPLVPDPGVPRFIGSMELEWPIEALEPLSFVLARLLDPLSIALERADRGAAAIRLDLRLVDRTMYPRVLQLPAAMRDARVLRTLLLLDLESHPPSAAIDVVTIEIDPAPARIVQYSLLERALPSPENTATLMARLRALVGEDRCGSPALLDTHRPDGFEMRAFNPAGRPAAGGGARVGGPGSCLRRLRPPVAVRVEVDRGRPVHVAIDRRGMPGGRIERHAGPWRTSGAWWNAPAVHWDRDEWDVGFADGTLCRLYRDRVSATWFLEGIID